MNKFIINPNHSFTPDSPTQCINYVYCISGVVYMVLISRGVNFIDLQVNANIHNFSYQRHYKSNLSQKLNKLVVIN